MSRFTNFVLLWRFLQHRMQCLSRCTANKKGKKENLHGKVEVFMFLQIDCDFFRSLIFKRNFCKQLVNLAAIFLRICGVAVHVFCTFYRTEGDVRVCLAISSLIEQGTSGSFVPWNRRTGTRMFLAACTAEILLISTPVLVLIISLTSGSQKVLDSENFSFEIAGSSCCPSQRKDSQRCRTMVCFPAAPMENLLFPWQAAQ